MNSSFFLQIGDADGLVAAIVQDVRETSEVLMLAWMNEQAVRRTLVTGQTHFYSRSRAAMWHKGESSGHVQDVKEIRIDCDADVILIKVRQVSTATRGITLAFSGGLSRTASASWASTFDPAKAYGDAGKT